MQVRWHYDETCRWWTNGWDVRTEQWMHADPARIRGLCVAVAIGRAIYAAARLPRDPR